MSYSRHSGYERNLRECRLAAGTSALCYAHLNLTSVILNDTGMNLTNLKVVILSASPSKLLSIMGKPSVPAYTSKKIMALSPLIGRLAFLE